MTPLELKNVVISTVKTVGKIDHPATLKPSIFDLMMIDAYIPLVFFYQPDNAHKGRYISFVKLVEHLKESLSQVLVPFFPFAGRWVRTYDARIRELQCTDEGVPFIEAFIDEELESVVNVDNFVSVELLGGFQFLGLDPAVFNQDVDFPLPPVFVQVTEFKCGGVALHVAFSHQIADGQGMLTFLKAWSQTSLDGQICVIPSHDRSLTKSLADVLEVYGASVDLDEEVVTEAIDGSVGPPSTRVDPGAGLRFPRKLPMSLKTLHVKREVIEDFKRDAAENKWETTTVDLICAHMWRSLNNLPESVDDKTSTLLGTWIDGRKRFHSPPLPVNYCGNASVLAYTPQIPSTELSSNSLLFAANTVHSTVRSIDASTWQDCMLNLFYLLENFDDVDYRQINVTSWHRFPIYEIGFGLGLGKPIFACWNMSCQLLPMGMVIILPPRPGLPVDALATVQLIVQKKNGADQALFTDQRFLSFFH